MKPSVWRILSTLPLCFLLLQISPIKAHPHSWVSVFTEIEGSNQKITGLTMYWTFDLITTSDALSGLDLSVEKQQQTLQLLASEMLVNIKKNNYFTHFKKHYTVLPFNEPKKATLTLQDYKLTLNFFLELETPLLLPVTGLNLEVYEDSHYADFLWLAQDDIQLSEHFHGDCELNIIEPHKVIDALSYDPLMMQESEEDNELGAMSTQRLTINCI